MSSVVVLLIIVGLFVLAFVVLYNSLVAKRNEVEEAYSGIEVQMKRRFDLIPNLVNTVKGYAEHEKSVLNSVTEARTRAMGATAVGDVAQTENMLSSTLKSLFAVAENYPDLKADGNFVKLQDELADTEDKMMAARRWYNSAVKTYNVALETVPTNFIGSMFKFMKREFFELAADERAAAEKAPEVKF